MAKVDTSLPVVIQGMPQLRRQLNALGDAAVNDLKDVHQQNADLVLNEARTIVPVRTGRLRETLRASGTKTGGRVRAGFKKVPYAGPIHFGWSRRNIKPNPFLYDALDKRRSEVVQNYERQIDALRRKYDL